MAHWDMKDDMNRKRTYLLYGRKKFSAFSILSVIPGTGLAHGGIGSIRGMVYLLGIAAAAAVLFIVWIIITVIIHQKKSKDIGNFLFAFYIVLSLAISFVVLFIALILVSPFNYLLFLLAAAILVISAKVIRAVHLEKKNRIE